MTQTGVMRGVFHNGILIQIVTWKFGRLTDVSQDILPPHIFCVRVVLVYQCMLVEESIETVVHVMQTVRAFGQFRV